MANRIKGITIEVNGDTTKLQSALKDVDGQIKTTKGYLSDIEKLLKLDPGNVELLTQKEKYLNEEIDTTRERLETLKSVSKDSLSPDEWDALQREIIDTEGKLEDLEKQYDDFGSVAKQRVEAAAQQMQDFGGKLSETGETLSRYVTLPIVGLGTAAVKSAADFDTSLSKVQAISGASAEDMEKLKAKASEMGETTKFSASEVADAFTYMAMAGWDTEKMLNGISGVLSLSAADGLDLATTSDIVTDAMTAFGMSAEEAGHFADVLAATSSSANTNVSMLGESFKYVAPVAGSLGYSVEDVAAALGLMANSGIKGSAAGTALRSALTNLSKPTKQMMEYMSKLGISMTDEAGNVKPLIDLLGELRGKMQVTSSEQVALNYLSEQDPELMAHMADGWETMTDAEQKYKTELSVGTSILEGMTQEEYKAAAAQQLGIKITKDRILTAEEYDELAQKLGQDTLNGLTNGEQAAAAAAIFGKEAMAGMLAVVNTSEDDFNSLTGAIDNSNGKAQEMADIMLDNLGGQLTILKSKVETLANSFGDILMPKVSAVVELLQDGMDWLNGLPDDTKTIVTNAAIIAAALGPILTIGGKIITAMGLIMAHPLIAGTLLVGGVLAGAIYTAFKNTEDLTDADWKLNDALTDLKPKIDAEKESIQNMKDARNNSIEAIEAEWDHIKDLKGELDGLVDENGRVKKGYEGRARFIMNELTKATGIEMQMNAGIIQNYKDISASIDEMIETRRNAAILNAYEEEYQAALKNSRQAQQNLNDALVVAQDAARKYGIQRDKVTTLEQAYNLVSQDGVDIQTALNSLGEEGARILAEYYEEGDTSYEVSKKLKEAYDDEADELAYLEDAYITSQQAVDDANDSYLNYQWTIDHYEGAAAAAISGDSKTIKAELDSLSDGYQSVADDHEQSLKRQVEDAQREYANIKQAYSEGAEGVTEEMVINANAQRLQAEKDLADYRLTVTNGFQTIADDNARILEEGRTKVENAVGGQLQGMEQKIRQGHGPQDAMQDMVDATVRTVENGQTRMEQQGQAYVGKYGSGMMAVKQNAYNAGANIAIEANSGAGAYSQAYSLGSDYGQGYYNGISSWTQHVRDKAWQLAQEALYGTQTGQASRSPSKASRKLGVYFGEGYELGIESEMSAVGKTANELAKTAIDAAAASPDVNSLYTSSAGFGRAASVDNRSVSYGATSINIYAQPGMDVNQLADAVQNRLALLQMQREAAFAS